MQRPTAEKHKQKEQLYRTQKLHLIKLKSRDCIFFPFLFNGLPSKWRIYQTWKLSSTTTTINRTTWTTLSKQLNKRRKTDSSTDTDGLQTTEIEVSILTSIIKKLDLLIPLHNEMKELKSSLEFTHNQILP